MRKKENEGVIIDATTIFRVRPSTASFEASSISERL